MFYFISALTIQQMLMIYNKKEKLKKNKELNYLKTIQNNITRNIED